MAHSNRTLSLFYLQHLTQYKAYLKIRASVPPFPSIRLTVQASEVQVQSYLYDIFHHLKR